MHVFLSSFWALNREGKVQQWDSMALTSAADSWITDMKNRFIIVFGVEGEKYHFDRQRSFGKIFLS